MGEHATWFNYLIPNFHQVLTQFREVMGLSLVNQSPVELQYILGLLVVCLIILVLGFIARQKMSDTQKALVPDERFSSRTFFETMIEGTLNIMEGSMDRKPAIYFLPLIGTCAFIIFFSNFIGLVPGFLPPTSNLSTTLAMSLVIFLATHVYGVKEHGLGYFAHFFGPIRKWYAFPLMILMFCIELISHFARPLSLSIRLMGNMFADHMVVGTFVALVPIVVPIPIMMLGVIVCIVQTLVFCILSTVYIGMAIAHDEH